MSSPGLVPTLERFALRPGRGGSVVLHETGVRLPRSRWLGGEMFSSWEDLTHLELGANWLRLGTRSGVVWLRRRDFLERDAPERLARALLQRVGRLADGADRLSRMARIEALARSPRPPWAVLLLALACLVAWALDRSFGPFVAHAGFFSASLATHGEAWRAVTANLLHGLPGDGPLGVGHLTLNLIGLLGVGALVELPLGPWRTAFVLGASGLGAMGAGALAGYEYAVGASGIVSGLAGALLWLELRRPEHLPVAWRVPRRFFVAILVVNALLPLVVPILAGAAHVGGFLGGAGAAALGAGPGLRLERPRVALVVADGLLAVLVALSLAGAAPLAAGRPAALARHAERLLEIPEPPPMVLNNAAWLIATARGEPSREALDHALELAERAVARTRRADPNLLDTLAEVQFQVGLEAAALATIDEAIALAPDERYFREQRRRFSGERPAGDRPEPPRSEPPQPPPEPQWPEPEDPGITV